MTELVGSGVNRGGCVSGGKKSEGARGRMLILKVIFLGPSTAQRGWNRVPALRGSIYF